MKTLWAGKGWVRIRSARIVNRQIEIEPDVHAGFRVWLTLPRDTFMLWADNQRQYAERNRQEYNQTDARLVCTALMRHGRAKIRCWADDRFMRGHESDRPFYNYELIKVE